MRLVAALVLAGLCCASAPPAVAVPSEAALTISADSSQTTFRVATFGSLPASATLADDTGRHAATVTVRPCAKACAGASGSCPTAPILHTSLDGSFWSCVRVRHIPVGTKVAGTLASATVSISLTIQRRVGFAWPLVWTIVSFLFAVLVAVAATRLVPQATTTALLRWERRSDDGVTGLVDWSRSGRLIDADVLARMRWAKGSGRQQVIAARKALAQLLTSDRIGSCPLRDTCRAEADRVDVRRDDMLTSAGARSLVAENLAALFEKADDAVAAMIDVADRVIALAPEKEKRARELVEATQKQAENYLSDETLDDYVDVVRAACRALRDLPVNRMAVPATLLAVIAPSEVGAAVVLRARSVVQSVVQPFAVFAPAIGLGLLLMIAAVATVFLSQYVANPVFGSTGDYVTLALAAFGSAQAAAVATALIATRGPTPWAA